MQQVQIYVDCNNRRIWGFSPSIYFVNNVGQDLVVQMIEKTSQKLSFHPFFNPWSQMFPEYRKYIYIYISSQRASIFTFSMGGEDVSHPSRLSIIWRAVALSPQLLRPPCFGISWIRPCSSISLSCNLENKNPEFIV